MADSRMQFKVENAQLIYRNLRGEVNQFNSLGHNVFCVILEPDVAERMAADGWLIKTTNPREEGEEGVPYIQIRANFDNKPPRVVMITNEGKTRTPLDKSTIGILDWVDIKTCDLIAVSFDWEFAGKSGTKAYLKTMFIEIEEDDLERKYAINDVPSAPGSGE